MVSQIPTSQEWDQFKNMVETAVQENSQDKELIAKTLNALTLEDGQLSPAGQRLLQENFVLIGRLFARATLAFKRAEGNPTMEVLRTRAIRGFHFVERGGLSRPSEGEQKQSGCKGLAKEDQDSRLPESKKANVGEEEAPKQPAEEQKGVPQQPAPEHHEAGGQPAAEPKELPKKPVPEHQEARKQPAEEQKELPKKPAPEHKEPIKQPAAGQRTVLHNQRGKGAQEKIRLLLLRAASDGAVFFGSNEVRLKSL